MPNVMQLCDTVRETSFAIHRFLKHGHLEKVYENALAHRLRKVGVDVTQQHQLPVYDEDGTLIGDYYADLLVDHQLIVELKAAKALAGEHVASCWVTCGRRTWNTVYLSISARRLSRYANSHSASQQEIEERSKFSAVHPKFPFASLAHFCGQKRGTWGMPVRTAKAAGASGRVEQPCNLPTGQSLKPRSTGLKRTALGGRISKSRRCSDE